jgi:hypothetical protein
VVWEWQHKVGGLQMRLKTQMVASTYSLKAWRNLVINIYSDTLYFLMQMLRGRNHMVESVDVSLVHLFRMALCHPSLIDATLVCAEV